MDAQKNAKISVHYSSKYTIRQEFKPPLDQGYSSCCEDGVTSTFTSMSSKMPSKYFKGNAQPEHHSNVVDFHCQIYFETMDTVTNCIVEYFNQKDYTRQLFDMVWR